MRTAEEKTHTICYNQKQRGRNGSRLCGKWRMECLWWTMSGEKVWQRLRQIAHICTYSCAVLYCTSARSSVGYDTPNGRQTTERHKSGLWLLLWSVWDLQIVMFVTQLAVVHLVCRSVCVPAGVSCRGDYWRPTLQRSYEICIICTNLLFHACFPNRSLMAFHILPSDNRKWNTLKLYFVALWDSAVVPKTNRVFTTVCQHIAKSYVRMQTETGGDVYEQSRSLSCVLTSEQLQITYFLHYCTVNAQDRKRIQSTRKCECKCICNYLRLKIYLALL